MELRVLQYFLAVTRAQSISAAAQALHLSQPTLSRQIKDMETELGKQLFIRGNRKITLTEDGMLLRKRAEEIVELVKRAKSEISLSNESVAGEIRVGTGETQAVRFLIRTAQQLQSEHPLVRFHVSSGDGICVMEELDSGLVDFGLVFGRVDSEKYDCIEIPYADTWGVLMRNDAPLAGKSSISPEDLWEQPLIISRQMSSMCSEIQGWLKRDLERINIVATYSLLYNGSLMVDEGMGYALCIDKIINTSEDCNLCFRPLNPPLHVGLTVIWKKYQTLTKANEKFLVKLMEI